MIANTLQPDPIEDIVNCFRAGLIGCLIDTGYAHFEVDCSIINREKGIVRIELMIGTKYSFTVSRKELCSRNNQSN